MQLDGAAQPDNLPKGDVVFGEDRTVQLRALPPQTFTGVWNEIA